ncbi:16S rRNA (uracil(1498)-N(3))-methyltransferase [Caenimonas koreensis]|uniref:Ribosomal RNA small subunit methyltransferase E n=1 Tax=Caenimonas koreensis DSM 17982 TaxID=1121255 RepID=A0A844B6D4_9BURK|nr:16S rRNA (uracil(1498)-N(3))-methyltransferase [Caenimonas koreensis]MRD46916.1 16S rRNA (uracil(1498)-N(3))-methyltransferase [Caenimonas koreensis DSM 17982]
MPRFHCLHPLREGDLIDLPDGAARHVQVLRLQPGAAITLFDGEGGEYDAVVERMGRSDVRVQVGAHHAIEREAPRAVHLAAGMPANERMDWLVEKATELGVASIQPLLTQRTVLRLAGDRAAKKQAHWQAIAVAACEQCGRNRVPIVHPVAEFSRWVIAPRDLPVNVVMSLAPGSTPLGAHARGADAVLALSGPEGGLSAAEESEALANGFAAITLGSRVLRAETASLALLAALTVEFR